MSAPIREIVDSVYRAESRQVLATLIRLLGDFDAAEEALHGVGHRPTVVGGVLQPECAALLLDFFASRRR